MSKRLMAALGLCVAGAAVSGLLLLQHHGEGPAVAAVDQVCGEGETSGCETVARSAWSSLGGIPVAAFGVLFYLSLSTLLALTLLLPDDPRRPLAGLAFAGLAVGLLVDLGLLGVQAFAVRAFCSLCVLTYVLGAAALFALLPAWRESLGVVWLLRSAEGRLAIAGWALGTLALAGAVLAAEVALDHREAARQLQLLGATAVAGAPDPEPSPARGADTTPLEREPSPEPVPEGTSGSEGEKASYWEQRAKELQQTLDDPQKLEQYFAQKARKEFDAAEVQTIDLANVPFKGSAEAPVKVVEYSDFLCPFCRNLAMGLSQFVPQAGGRVAVYFKNFPLDQTCNGRLKGSTHPGACWLALGAVCAHYQGKFEAYHDRVFSTELRNPEAADVVRLAGEAGLNAAAIEGCLEDPRTKETLAAQIEEGHRLGVHATPTVYVNGKKLPRINDFVAVVDAEAQRKGFAPLAPR